jgi:hypothetical protein
MISIHTIKWIDGESGAMLASPPPRLKPARDAISGAATIGMSAADIAASLSRSPSVDVPIQVELTDAAGIVVARPGVDGFAGVPQA